MNIKLDDTNLTFMEAQSRRNHLHPQASLSSCESISSSKISPHTLKMQRICHGNKRILFFSHGWSQLSLIQFLIIELLNVSTHRWISANTVLCEITPILLWTQVYRKRISHHCTVPGLHSEDHKHSWINWVFNFASQSDGDDSWWTSKWVLSPNVYYSISWWYMSNDYCRKDASVMWS